MMLLVISKITVVLNYLNLQFIMNLSRINLRKIFIINVISIK
jgi:hypothetical protein